MWSFYHPHETVCPHAGGKVEPCGWRIDVIPRGRCSLLYIYRLEGKNLAEVICKQKNSVTLCLAIIVEDDCKIL